ncbi:MAG: endonuclease III domain-containing protein [Pseudomonadota bacterium]
MGKKRTRQTGALSFSASSLSRIYQRLFECHGPQHWWPGDTPFEIMLGAVLTQNTTWSNVEQAIANLKAIGPLEPHAILQLGQDELATALCPSGYFNVKAKRLRALCEFLLEHPDLEQLEDQELRARFLAVHGIGPETADDILLYAYNRSVFVIDTYTRRLFTRLGLVEGKPGYETLRQGFEQALLADAALFNEYHALIDHHAKQVCRPKPDCKNCCLNSHCKQCIDK